MNKKVKWGIIIFIGAGLIGGGIYSQLPKTNEELAAADKVMTGKRGGKKVLNVNARIIKPQLLKDEIQISGSLLPDEEVDLSFETSGKIIEINFEEGSFVKKGQLLAKVNDRPLQAQLQRLVSQLKLAEDRVFRQNALLERDAVSKEAYEQVKTELATLNADIDLIESNIAQTELRAPFDGVIGLRQVSVGTYASPSTIVAKLTKLSPLKVEFAVPERYANDVKTGAGLDFTLEGKLNTFHATVYARESKIARHWRGMRVYIAPAIPLLRFLRCQFKSVHIVGGGKGNNCFMLPAITFVVRFGKFNPQARKSDFTDQGFNAHREQPQFFVTLPEAQIFIPV